MSLGVITVLLHILTAGWFVSGLVGRNVTYRYARASRSVETTAALLKASEYFETRMVFPGSMAVLILGLLAGWLQGWPILGILQGGTVNWLIVSLILYLSLVPFIPLYLAPRRKERGAAMASALAKGEITGELTAALNDKGVLRIRAAELLVIIVVTVLMVTKPF